MPSTKPARNAPIGSRASANAVIEIANKPKPMRISRRLSHSTKIVPTASAPRHAPSPHVAYSQLYCGDFSSIPKLSRAIAGNNPTYGNDSSENVVRLRRIRVDTGLLRTSRMPDVSNCRPLSCGTCSAAGRCTDARATMTNRYVTALMRKNSDVVTPTVLRPATTIGPTTREPLIIVEFSEMAPDRSCLCTRGGSAADHDGAFNTLRRPTASWTRKSPQIP